MGIGLPVIVDIAISLVFTYFTLSLLSSEIHNILKALLQWRAAHLKESIEGLLVGNDRTQLQEARTLANQLYSNPLIQSLNHQTKRGVADAVRSPLRAIGNFVPSESRTFGDQQSGPSKIHPLVFSRSLLNTFDFVGIYRQLVACRLEVGIKSLVPSLQQYEERLSADVTAILKSFTLKKISLDVAIQGLAKEAQKNKEIFKPELFQHYMSSPEGEKRFSDAMHLSLVHTIRSVRQYCQIKEQLPEELKKHAGGKVTFDDAKTALEQIRSSDSKLNQILPPATDQAFLTLALIITSPAIQDLIENLPPIPPALGDNLEVLADKALEKTENLTQETIQFEQEIATWFDESMVRAKDVYRQNSKLIAIIIAFAIAIIANADTFYMIDRFSKEKVITASVIEVANHLPQDALQQSEQINKLSKNLLIPIGWDTPTIKQQQDIQIIPFWFIPFWIQRVPGWAVTGVAVSMGASFWYDLLKKLVDLNKAEDPISSSATPAAVSPKSS